MKKLLLIIAIIGGIKYYKDHPGNFTKLDRGDVILYATDWCGYCKKTRAFFAANGIIYTEYNIERSAYGKAEYDKINGNGVPVVDVKGTIIRGYSERNLRRALGL